MTSTRDVIILCWGAPAPGDRAAHKIAAFLGVEATYVALDAQALADGIATRRLMPRCACLIVAAETLASAAAAMPTGAAAVHRLTSAVAEHVFLHGFQPTGRHDAILRALSSDGLRGVAALHDPNASFRVAGGNRSWCGPFSGLAVEAAGPTPNRVFVERGGERPLDVLIRAGGKPFFVRTRRGGAQVFFAASDDLADLDLAVGRDARPLSWFPRLVPLMMFLRGALGDRVWHNDSPKASFIIDDPPLNATRYGFLEYRRLADSTRRHGFSACIAYIPWNYRRSRTDIGALFSSDDRRLGLCVHGCDHTRAEFATTDVQLLAARARLALERMATLRRISGARFDQVMVFPQGLFSEEAMTALRDSGYLAAINSDVSPSTQPETLLLRDLLDVAVTKYADFPLFGRRYPQSVAEFAFDLFLGKPAFAVEHHGYFRNGYAALESFVARLNAVERRLEWTDVGTICSSACLTRTVEDDHVQVRFYCDRFRLANAGTRCRTYSLLRRHTSNRRMEVTVNGLEAEWRQEGDCLDVRVTLPAGSTADVSVLARGAAPVALAARSGRLGRLRVGVRRRVSEFRDNHVETNALLNALATYGGRLRRAVHARLVSPVPREGMPCRL